jgi:NADP-dependent 3-hydroxy acid dehydrogenase YdfG
VQQELGGANIFVNNAGVMLTAPFASDQREEHRRMVETNLLGAMTVTEVFLDQLRANGGGDLVNISSVAGRVAPAGFAAYAATKWGMNGWSEALRVELQPDIRVMVIEPGAIATELSDYITHADSKRAAKEYLDMGHPGARYRRRDRLCRQPATAHDAQRDPRAPHHAGHVSVDEKGTAT